MKKFTLLIAMLVCAVGFSQNHQNISFDGNAKAAKANVNVAKTTSVVLQTLPSNPEFAQIASGVVSVPTAAQASNTTVTTVSIPEILISGPNELSLIRDTQLSTNGSTTTSLLPACNQEHPISATAGGGTGSSVDSTFKSAVDITVAAGEDFTLDTVDATFLTFAPSDPPTTANIVYYADDAGLPGMMIGMETVVPTILSSAPWANPVADQYVTTMAVTPFTFSGDAAMDTKYWVEISMGTATNQATVFWEYTEDTPVEGEAYAQIDSTVGTWGIVDPIREAIYNFGGNCEPMGGGGPCGQEHPLSAVAGGGSGSSVDSTFKTASDITVTAGENFIIENIDATFLTFAPSDPPTTANIVYYADDAGLPGMMIGMETVVPTIVSSGPWANPVADQYVTTMAVTPFTFNGDAAMDTKYWIEISMGTATNQATVFWEYTEDTPVEGEAYAQIDSTVGTWGIVDPIREVAYNYTGTCEPIIVTGGPCGQEHPLSAVAGGGSGSSVDSTFKTASDITVTAGENFIIENIDATFLTFAPSDPPTTANIVYYADDAGLPGTMIGMETVVPTIVSSGPWANPVADQYVTTMAVTPFTFNGDAGMDTKYWIEISMGTATNQATVFWEYTEDTPVEGEAYAQIDSTVGTWGIVDPIREVAYNYTGTCEPIGGGPTCTSTTYDAMGLPIDIDGAGTSTADCAAAPNLVPIMVPEVGVIGADAFFENLTINITHTFTGDLDIFLVAPTGEEIELTTDNGGGGDNFTDTVFEDGGMDITAGAAPFTGTFEPEGGTFAAAFAGVSITGEWNLRLCDDAGGDTGTIDSVSMNICIPEQPLTNEVCGGATPVACGDVISGDTSDNTDDGGSNASPDEWYSFTGTGAGQIVTASLCGSGYDTFLSVFDACGGAVIVSNDDSCGLQSEVTFLSDGTSTYYIAVEGFGTNVGLFDLAITCVDVAENDECVDALPIACGETLTGSTSNASIDVAPECNATTITAPGVWYTYTDTSGLVTDIVVNTCTNGSYDTKLSVYTGDCGTLTCVGGNDDTCALQSEVAFQSDGNSTFYILVHGFGANVGDFDLTMTCLPVPPPNDMIANSIDVDQAGLPYVDPAVPMPAATMEAGSPVGCDNTGALGVWYNFVAELDGEATARVTTPAPFTSITFYTAPNEMAVETDLELVDWYLNQCVPGTEATIPVVAGQAYYVYAANHGGITDIEIDGTFYLGANDNKIEGFAYAPNPAQDVLNLTSIEVIDNVEVYSLLGQKVLTQEVNALNAQINVAQLAQGAYLMKVSVNGQVGTYKVLKQ